MSRIVLVLPLVALLAACATQSDAQLAFASRAHTCADIGIPADSAGFNQCVAEQSRLDEQLLTYR